MLPSSLPFKVIKNTPGYVKLADGTILIIRVTVSRIDELDLTPTGPNLGIGLNVVISAISPQELKEKVKDKPLPLGTDYLRRLDIWELVDIVEVSNASEEIIYSVNSKINYRILAEIETTIVSRTLEYKDEMGNPIYNVRWAPRIVQKIEK